MSSRPRDPHQPITARLISSQEAEAELVSSLAAALQLTARLASLRRGFSGSHLGPRELGRWLLEAWVAQCEAAATPATPATADTFEASICSSREGQLMWRRLKPFFSPM